MKKRDLLLSGLFLFSVSVFAQPIRYADDAKQIFLQDFESDVQWQQILLNDDPNRPTTLYTWDINPVDEIDEVVYYKKQYYKDRDTVAYLESEGTVSNVNIYTDGSGYEIAGIRDTLMFLYNGVVRTDAKWPEDSIFSYDSHDIAKHTRATLNGDGAGPSGESDSQYGLSRYGEDGGTKYFTYTSADGTGSNGYSSDNKAAAEYRRNLFVRLTPGAIEPNSSYRVTVFVKAEQLGGIEPQFALNLMRGYFHSEKSFIVSFDNRNEYAGKSSFAEFNKTVEYEDGSMVSETGKWQKITLMAYYANDSLGRATPYLKGFYWPEDWTWQTKANKADSTVSEDGDTTMVFRYIQQPDKYFVRMSFRSDSTKFMVDNLSLTKSWIGGVEHYNDMLRVDFGYDTNLGDLAEAAKKINKIATVEVPGDYFVVWARWGDEWDLVPILTAEYQGDGYMYMWTKPYDDGTVRDFEGADEVLVSFRNPVDKPELTLKYKGDVYPNGLDTNWVKAGKIVFDFHNEISSLNPTIVVSPKTKKTVKSLKYLPPVLQYEPYEEGTFGLDPKMRTMTVKFSRTVAYDNAGALTNLTQVTLKKGNVTEYWNIKSSDDQGYTVIERPSTYSGDLAGDYVLAFKQVTHNPNADPNDETAFGDVYSFNYHFGAFDANPYVEVVAQSDWRGHLADFTFGGRNTQRPLPDNIYMHDGSDMFQAGEGVVPYPSTKIGLYPLRDDTLTIDGTKVPDNCFFYLSSRKNTDEGNLYAIEHLKAGKYAINFKFAGRNSVDYPMSFYFYAKPDGTLEDGNDKGYLLLKNAVKTQLIKNRKPAANSDMGEGGFDKEWTKTAELITCYFDVPEDGDYVFEWVNTGSNSYYGVAIGNYWITNAGDLSFGPVRKLKAARDLIGDKITAVSVEKYSGATFETLKATKTSADGFIQATIDANRGHAPSAYDSVIAVIDAAIKVMNERVDTVDLFNNTLGNVTKALSDKTFDYTDAYKALGEVETEMKAVQIPVKTNAELAALVAKMNKAMSDLTGIDLITKRIKELAKLTQTLGSTITEDSKIKAQLESISSDNDDLANVLKAAAKLEMYKKFDQKLVDSLDVTPFIKNYYLYATPIIVERMDKAMPQDWESLNKPASNGANIQHVRHQYNDDGKMPIWVMILENEYTTLFPGWTVKAYHQGNSMITPDVSGYPQFKAGATIFDGNLAMDWSSQAELKTTLEDLPIGYYHVAVELPEHKAKPQWGSGTVTSTFKATTKIADKDSVRSVAYNADGKTTLKLDSVEVLDGKMDLYLELRSNAGWSRADNFSMLFQPKKGFDYAGAVAAQEAELTKLLTVVDAGKALAEGVEFFTLGGMKIDAPKAGQILIRKKQANGKVIVDKVMLK